MKKNLFLLILLTTQMNFAQNTFPATGNVGIGTTNPSEKLDVNGVMQLYNKDTPSATWDNMRMWSEGENSIIEANGDEKGLVIRSNKGNKILLMSNVGIATTNPDEKLTVNGKIHAQEVRIDLSSPMTVPDYVFANDYKLKTLQEVEDYVKANNHLPEIPSAKEIEKNGLMLAEMNMSLLKKVEELTLYAIEQGKKSDQMMKYIETQNEIILQQNKRLEKLEEKQTLSK